MKSLMQTVFLLVTQNGPLAELKRVFQDLDLDVDPFSSMKTLKDELHDSPVPMVVVSEDHCPDPHDFLDWIQRESPVSQVVYISKSSYSSPSMEWINRGGFAWYGTPLDEETLRRKFRPYFQALQNHRFLLETHQNLSAKLREDREDLSRKASHDGLTGLPNREHFLNRAEKMLSRAKLHRRPFSFVLMDIDRFKDYNDQHGHPAGDRALEKIGEIIRGEIRNTDLPGRLGGEEFGVLLPGTDQNGACVTAERIRNAIENCVFPLGDPGNVGRLTVSIGISSHPDHGSDVERLYELADRAVYQSKDQGRNQTTMTEIHHFSFAPDNPSEVDSVSLVGDFNGWSPGNEPLEQKNEQRWTRKIPLPQGPIRYAFCIDGEKMVPDHSAKRIVDGPNGQSVNQIVI